MQQPHKPSSESSDGEEADVQLDLAESRHLSEKQLQDVEASVHAGQLEQQLDHHHHHHHLHHLHHHHYHRRKLEQPEIQQQHQAVQLELLDHFSELHADEDEGEVPASPVNEQIGDEEVQPTSFFKPRQPKSKPSRRQQGSSKYQKVFQARLQEGQKQELALRLSRQLGHQRHAQQLEDEERCGLQAEKDSCTFLSFVTGSEAELAPVEQSELNKVLLKRRMEVEPWAFTQDGCLRPEYMKSTRCRSPVFPWREEMEGEDSPGYASSSEASHYSDEALEEEDKKRHLGSSSEAS
ncbi:unnamed protein product [Polarella glacialis]|uniref:Uncharacterized protein n=1 Tax=Polarella glacialis TaxID=89957 RepID=A0A813JAL0_POLGL|nr:unnamed protein product [Polarella glacialis]